MNIVSNLLIDKIKRLGTRIIKKLSVEMIDLANKEKDDNKTKVYYKNKKDMK